MCPVRSETVLVLFTMALVSMSSAAPWIPPWTSNSSAFCTANAPTSSLVCQLQASQCDSVQSVFAAKDPSKVMKKCGQEIANSPAMKFLGLSVKGPGIINLLRLDNSSSVALNKCYLNSSSLLELPALTLNRTAITLGVTAMKLPQPISGAILGAITTCPEPISFNPQPFLQCLSNACMTSTVEVVKTEPLVTTEGQTAL